MSKLSPELEFPTAAERFFGRSSPLLFELVLARVSQLPPVRHRRPRVPKPAGLDHHFGHLADNEAAGPHSGLLYVLFPGIDNEG